MAGRATTGRLWRRRTVNPYRAAVSLAAENPRAVAVGGSLLAVTGGMAVLLALSSAQAFLMLSQQSANNTGNRLSLVIEGAPEAEQAAAGTGTGGDDGPTGAAPPNGTVGRDDVVSVKGILVHESIAADVRALLDAAEADGIELGGWGWRDGQTQIRLRRQHCGTSEYAIYHKPSSQCRPPTARPGRSQHERGLAIDFTYAGRSISTRNNRGFRWLQDNAAAFGLKNLQSEPWHWSTTGR